KAIAEHMVMSKRTSAHVTTIHKVDMTHVEKMRHKHKADFQARYGLSLTYLPFITRATVEGLRAYPLLNASIDGANIVYHNVINQPQVAILGAGVVEKQPVVIDDAIAIRSICYLSLTFDHRLIDGALADQFTGKVKSVLENWSDEVL